MGDKAGYAAELKKARDEARSKNPKQIRARARRKGGLDTLTVQEKKAMLQKPMEEWDLEELAKGRPKDKNGKFTGRAPSWITRDMHEKSIDMFKDLVRQDMRSHAVVALNVIKDMLENDDEDARGKPLVPSGVKADLAKFLIEHLVGKPTQPVQADINVKLQGILGAVLVQPGVMEEAGYVPSSSHREMKELTVVEDPDDD